MTNMLKMIKQAASLKKDAQRLQGQLSRLTVEGSAGGGVVTVVARGDGTLERVKIDAQAIEGRHGDLERLVLEAVNGALDEAKRLAAREMSKLTADLGLPGLFDAGL